MHATSTGRKRPLTRSEVMSRIRSADTKPELAIRSWLWCHGVRYRLKQVVHGTRPDLAWRNRKLAVFVDGCYWHGCPQHCRRPSSNAEYWNHKINRNMERDQKTSELLRSRGWMVLRFWEHEVSEDIVAVGKAILRSLQSGQQPSLTQP